MCLSLVDAAAGSYVRTGQTGGSSAAVFEQRSRANSLHPCAARPMLRTDGSEPARGRSATHGNIRRDFLERSDRRRLPRARGPDHAGPSRGGEPAADDLDRRPLRRAADDALGYTRDGDRYVVVGSNSGLPQQPAWLANIRANPVVTVEVGVETFPARATITTGAERQRLWTSPRRGDPALRHVREDGRSRAPGRRHRAGRRRPLSSGASPCS